MRTCTDTYGEKRGKNYFRTVRTRENGKWERMDKEDEREREREGRPNILISQFIEISLIL